MNPEPPVTRKFLPMLQSWCKPPIIIYLFCIGRKAVLIWVFVIIEFIRNIQEISHLIPNSLKSMVYHRRNLDNYWIVVTDKELIYCLIGSRILSSIVQNDFHHPVNTGQMVGLLFMVMPRLNHIRIGCCYVNLTEF